MVFARTPARGRLGRRELNDVCSDDGIRLTPELRSRLERAFGADLSAVRLHATASADAACRALGARAFAWGEHVCLSAEAALEGPAEQLPLLAHEVAHVLQQRLGRDRPSGLRDAVLNDRVEAEADAAAEAIVAGRPVTVAVADGSGEPACWDLAGHYYTPYLLYLNTGMDPERARRLALWCWMPDQVQEFDATYAAISWGKPIVDALPVFDPLFGGPAGTLLRGAIRQGAKFAGHDVVNHQTRYPGAQAAMRAQKRGEWANERQFVKAVQSGMHVLSGTEAAQQTVGRTTTFMDQSLESLHRGVALHPLGDCYAHRTYDKPGTLHGDLEISGVHLPVGHMFDGTGPDSMFNEKRAWTYLVYFRDMHDTINKRHGVSQGIAKLPDLIAALSAMLHPSAFETMMDGGVRRKRLPMSWANVRPEAKKASEFAVAQTEEACAWHIRKVARDLIGVEMKRDERADRRKPIPWTAYYNERRTDLEQDTRTRGSDAIFADLQESAAKWSGEALLK